MEGKSLEIEILLKHTKDLEDKHYNLLIYSKDRAISISWYPAKFKFDSQHLAKLTAQPANIWDQTPNHWLDK